MTTNLFNLDAPAKPTPTVTETVGATRQPRVKAGSPGMTQRGELWARAYNSAPPIPVYLREGNTWTESIMLRVRWARDYANASLALIEARDDVV